MLTLWALVITLAIQAGAFNVLPPPALPPLLTRQVPLSTPLNAINTLPVPLPLGNLPTNPSIPKSSPSTKRLTGTPRGRCQTSARYFMSTSKLDEYLHAALPTQIEKMLMCAKVDLAGAVGSVLATVSSSDLLSVLDVTSSLNILGDGGLGGVLGKGSGGKSSQQQPPLSSVATSAASSLGALGSILPISAENPVKGLANTIGLSDLPLPLNGVVDQVGKLQESTEGMLKSAVPEGISSAVTDLLENNLEGLLLGLEVQRVTVENMTSTMTDDGILFHAMTTAFIGGNGLAGPAISLLGIQVHGDVTLNIGISTNNTQCVNLQVQDKDIKAKKVTFQILEMLTNSLPVPMSLPLNDVIPPLLTVTMKENIQNSKSCDIDLRDFNKCENSTGFFKYQVTSSRFSAQGLSINYCAKAILSRNTVPVPGSPLPPDPKNANISITLSHTILKTIVTQSAKQSSVKMNNVDASITQVVYSYQRGNKISATYWVSVKKNGDAFATGKTTIIISHACKISKDKLMTDMKILSSEHTVTPSETTDKVQGVLAAVLKNFLSALKGNLVHWNVPQGVTSVPPINAKVEVVKSNDLQAAI
ncbi:vomeromodulin-like [Manis pentadactyla]|uniref:vomeromodulin-like n=1 Tax=Manis pentadactyla TaxID=143292 RepID=UPI0018745FF5|nr:vomeromodulin-like [Manis pentadactyla]